MAQEIKKPTTLAICGKIVNIEKIFEKSQAQFAAQLKANGIELPAAELEALYNRLITERTPKTDAPEAEQK